MTLSDPQVSRFLANDVVPCWETVRPVPKVTIDFSDGRVLKRTLQGNTVIYLCLPDGRVLDALPGVYTPQDFLGEMKKTLGFLRAARNPILAEPVRAWHEEQSAPALQYKSRLMMTMSKMVVEGPMLKALGARPSARPTPNPGPSRPRTLAELKEAFAAASAAIEDLSKQPASVEQLRRSYLLYPKDARPTPEQLGKMAVEIDSRNNINRVRPIVHLLLATYDDLPTPRQCRDVVFKQILHVPIDDPYLGLADALVPGTPAGQ